MAEIEDHLLRGEFAAYREAYASVVHPAGPSAVRTTVRHRRRRNAVVVAAAVVLAVAIPVGANAALDGRSKPPPPPAQTVEPGPSESVAPPSPPSPTPTTVDPTPSAPDGRISRKQLLAVRVDLPAWQPDIPNLPKSCTTGDVRLRPAQQGDMMPVLSGDPDHGDLDGDGATETVALVSCQYGEASAKQVVAFDRDDADRIVALGRVVGTREGMDDITDFSVQPDGTVRVRVADIQPCCGTPTYWARHQWRTYTLGATGFTQTGGPAAFGPDTRLTNLVLTAGDLVLGAADSKGDRLGKLSVTVANRGSVDVPQLGFAGLDLLAAGGDLSDCTPETTSERQACLLDGLRAGQRRTYTFPLRLGPEDQQDPLSVAVVHFDAAGRSWADSSPKDNSVDVRIVR